jgi:hypothetical protein
VSELRTNHTARSSVNLFAHHRVAEFEVALWSGGDMMRNAPRPPTWSTSPSIDPGHIAD